MPSKWRVIENDSTNHLTYEGQIELNSIQSVITSPPYFGQRVYSESTNEVGKDQSLEDYIQSLVHVFDLIKPYLHSTGTIWVNLGDKRNGSGGAGGDYRKGGKREGQPLYGRTNVKGIAKRNLLGIPYRFAFAMQANGWNWIGDCVWNKLSGLPESCNDRPNYRHESWMMFTKTLNFYFNKRHVKEYGTHGWNTVWDFRPKPYNGKHTATYHPDLVVPIIIGSSPELGVCSKCFAPKIENKNLAQDGALKWGQQCNCNVGFRPALILDPFCGAGNTGIATLKTGRDFIGIELNPLYVKESIDNIKNY